ncbi:MAG: extracellular solute-binding protein [Betaproteobacteria bacterium]|nr:extracellular solute-binding protein [Betaproteobacteria bacterium]
MRAASRRDIVVVTSYHDELVSRFEAAFEKANPAWRLRVIWRAAHDAMPMLRQPGPEGVDVYWSPSPGNFARLKAENLLRKLDIERSGLPGRLGNTQIDDADGYYAAFEVAGYGFAVNPAYLKEHDLPEPRDWIDLADPRYAGHLSLPNPARVAFATVIPDIPLQAYGWEKAWAMWSAIVANAKLAGRGGAFVTDEAANQRSIGISIDFFVAGAIAKGAPLRFIYPRHGGVNPSQVGILAGSQNPEGARAFASFVLSEAGQRLLTHPDIRRLPVRPSVYQGIGRDYFDPFAAAAAGEFSYDSKRGLKRLPVIAALFDTVLVRRQEKLALLWPKARKLEGKRAEEAVRLLSSVPVSEAQADQDDWQQIFANRRDDKQAESKAVLLEREWAEETDARLARVEKLLDQS